MIFVLLAALLIPGRADVTSSVVQIHSDAFERKLGFEEAILVKQKSIDFVSGSGDNIQFEWDDSIVAVVHTHPDKGFEKPSPQDIETAKLHHIFVYVVSESQIWYATGDGQIGQVK